MASSPETITIGGLPNATQPLNGNEVVAGWQLGHSVQIPLSLFQPIDPALTSIAGLTLATDKILYTDTANTFALTSLSPYARTLLDDADAPTARATLGLGGAATLAVGTTAGTVAAGNDSRFNFGSFKNSLINGKFDFWRRGVTSLAAGTGKRYLADRWFTQSTGSTVAPSQQAFTLGQTAVPTNPRFFHRSVVASVAGASNFATLSQAIEGVRTGASTTRTFSFWMKADSTRPFSVEFVQNFGTGGSPSAPVTGIGVQKLSATTAWQKYTVTVALPSIASATLGTNGDDALQVIFYFDAGSSFDSRTGALGQQSGTFDTVLCQLEPGALVTDFEDRALGAELVLCERYLPSFSSSSAVDFICSGQAYNTNAQVSFLPFHTPVRVPPTSVVVSSGAHFSVSQASSTNVAATALSYFSASKNGAVLNVTGVSGVLAGNASALFFNNAAGYLYLEGAEL